MTVATRRIYVSELAEVLENLIDFIQHRESYLFSASIAKVTREEAETMAARLIQSRCYDAAYISDDEILIELLTTLRFGGAS